MKLIDLMPKKRAVLHSPANVAANKMRPSRTLAGCGARTAYLSDFALHPT
jgi:hypothetical protein